MVLSNKLPDKINFFFLIHHKTSKPPLYGNLLKYCMKKISDELTKNGVKLWNLTATIHICALQQVLHALQHHICILLKVWLWSQPSFLLNYSMVNNSNFHNIFFRVCKLINLGSVFKCYWKQNITVLFRNSNEVRQWRDIQETMATMS